MSVRRGRAHVSVVAAVLALLGAGGIAAAASALHRTVGPPSPEVSARAVAARSERVWFSDARGGMSFGCRLDDGAWEACRSPVTYAGLSDSPHVVDVRAIDGTGRRSSPARYRWRFDAANDVWFSITGRPEDRLLPGAGPVRIPLTLTNRTGTAVHVTRLSVRLVDSSLPRGCPAGGFQITQSSVSAARPITVGGEDSVRLPVRDGTAPTIALLDLPVDQDACEGARLTLSFDGRETR